MALPQVLTPSITITAAETYLMSLCSTIFSARDLKTVEEEIWRANKIKIGLRVLNYLTPSEEAYQQVLVGLDKLVPLYNQTYYPTITL